MAHDQLQPRLRAPRLAGARVQAGDVAAGFVAVRISADHRPRALLGRHARRHRPRLRAGRFAQRLAGAGSAPDVDRLRRRQMLPGAGGGDCRGVAVVSHRENRTCDDEKSPAGKTDCRTMGACHDVLAVMRGARTREDEGSVSKSTLARLPPFSVIPSATRHDSFGFGRTDSRSRCGCRPPSHAVRPDRARIRGADCTGTVSCAGHLADAGCIPFPVPRSPP
jgi:hypothetical protein